MSTPTNNILYRALMGKLPSPIAGDDDAHFAALGRFVVQYASAEAMVHMLARKLSGMSDEKARAIFGGMRLVDITASVRAMLRLDNALAETCAEVDACLIHLDAIAERRHRVVHRHVTYQGTEGLHVTNVFTSKSLAAAEIDAFRLEDLEAMSSDCGRIFLRLGFIEEPSKKQAMEESLLKFLFRPWSYTPPQRGSRKKQRRKAQKELPLQQPSSEG